MAAIHELYKGDDQQKYDLQVCPNLLKKSCNIFNGVFLGTLITSFVTNVFNVLVSLLSS